MGDKRIGCGTIFLILLGVGFFISLLEGEPPEPTEAERAAEERSLAPYRAQRLVKAVLRDPESAEFRHVKPGVCGYVNARNGFGGMSGFQRFVITDAGPVLETHPQLNLSAFNRLWRENCTPASD